jgi:3-hydroxyacyl-[acyl-carrier-protein] dehydratase
MLILDPASLDCEDVLFDREQIYKTLPQKYEFAQLDAVIHADPTGETFAAYRDVRADEWWCRGHMPQQAIFPGVLMIECAAQLSAFAQLTLREMGDFVMGFGGIDAAKFRDSVFPPSRIIFIGKALDTRMRKFSCQIQAFVSDRMVFEGTITGIRLKI